MSHGVIPVGNLSAEQVRSALLAATSAPSLHNTQPWRFHCTTSAIELYPDFTRALPAADRDHRELLLACGAALLNLRMAIRSVGIHPDVRLLPSAAEPDLLAAVRPQGRRPATPEEVRLAEAISRRRTNRRPFFDAVVPGAVRGALRHAAEVERSWLAPIERDQLPALRELAHRAHQIQQQDPLFVEEWTHWTARHDSHVDGVPRDSSGPLPEPQDEWVLRDFSGGSAPRRIAGKDFEPQPLLAVIGSFHDGTLARIQAGQATQRVLLTATASGLAASFVSQIIEVPSTRRELRKLLGGGLWPQAVLRLGHGPATPPTPRRPLDNVVAVDNGPLRGSPA